MIIAGAMGWTCPVTHGRLRLVPSGRTMVEPPHQVGRGGQAYRLTPRQRNGPAPCAAGGRS